MVQTPADTLKKFPEKKRERFLTYDELEKLGYIIKQLENEGIENPAGLYAIRLLIYTGCRLGEILSL